MISTQHLKINFCTLGGSLLIEHCAGLSSQFHYTLLLVDLEVQRASNPPYSKRSLAEGGFELLTIRSMGKKLTIDLS